VTAEAADLAAQFLRVEAMLEKVSQAVEARTPRDDSTDRRAAAAEREAAKWENELSEMRKKLADGARKGHKLVRSGQERRSENDVTASKPNHLGA
jgi:hypothetical protein